jgi:heme exporter protein B
VGQFAMGLNGYPILALLLAGSILAVIVTPFVIAFSLKLAWLS